MGPQKKTTQGKDIFKTSVGFDITPKKIKDNKIPMDAEAEIGVMFNSEKGLGFGTGLSGKIEGLVDASGYLNYYLGNGGSLETGGEINIKYGNTPKPASADEDLEFFDVNFSETKRVFQDAINTLTNYVKTSVDQKIKPKKYMPVNN